MATGAGVWGDRGERPEAQWPKYSCGGGDQDGVHSPRLSDEDDWRNTAAVSSSTCLKE